ncbi:SGNH/GDSL hydrolase family protein [Vulcaniibacterium tengchongense]|uniref:Lysophospholipase L1-like esterase n=1 Tax=Vulcaniibacterium tengchongense TaxID=1273429 RepID=A0A3N4W894_9GAMM|nr:SGNH/GDSL hydrolase family protein [Vulcaniibacterium tengchongense]RPE81444.1 lysophospholipase L1-like esterase [Vulcaniibacterium tengchongense]
MSLSWSTLVLALLAAVAAGPVPARAWEAAAHAELADPARWEPDIVAFERADAERPPAPGGVLFVGSSSIRMWPSLATDFPGVAALNRGFGGSRVRDATYYAERIVAPYRPRAIVFYAGDNDLAEGRTPRQVRDDFAAFVAKTRRLAPRARIAFVSIKPSPSRAALMPAMRQANALVRAWAERQADVDYLDVFTPMLDAQGQPRRELFLGDELHMNESGYAIWSAVVRAWLAGLPPRR